MKQKLTLTVVMLAFATFSVAPPAQADDHCSGAKVAGEWGFTTSGVLITPTGTVPIGAVGRYTADAAGNVVGRQTQNVGGVLSKLTFTGTATVNPDCTGEATFQVFDATSGALVRTSTLDVVFVENGRGSRSIFTSLVLPNGASLPTVLTIDAKKIFPGSQ